ncbi:MAG TPA: AI-2E family transporter [Candidatus Acidoferrales bacterium]|nr:AI-2E family transporter [Candidatus Acidoferrales bacterium]
MISNVSLKLLALALILVFLYLAASVVITLLLSILVAYFLDPVVEFLEKMRMPRTLASMLTVLFLIGVLLAVGYGLYSRTSDFAANWPKYSGTLKEALNSVETRLNGLERQVSESTSEQKGRSRTLAGAENALRAAVVHLIGSLSGLVLEVTFVPFLVFFMLSEKQGVWHSTLQLFPVSRRTSVKETLEDLRDVLRDYLVGMSLMTLIVIAASSVFFWAMGLDYPILIGIVSGLLNMVPYFGAVLSWLPPFLIALAKLHSAGSYALIAGALMAIHMFSNNLLAPALVGKKVRLNALSITIALLFWGWIWGGMGLLLAIPVTASLRVICDHTESWKPVGRWLSAE